MNEMQPLSPRKTASTQIGTSPSKDLAATSNSDNSDGPSSVSSRILAIIFFVPPWCRWDAANPPKFRTWHNVLFALAGGCTVANLYYNHPILNVLAQDFHTSQAGVSKIPTLMQAGYATGLVLILPLGDMMPIRPITLGCIGFTAILWIGLCTTNIFPSFLALSYITAITTVTPQIMLPLVAGLASPENRAVSIAMVSSGNALGIVIARITSGVVTSFISWRYIYWLGLGLQVMILVLLWLFMPNYPFGKSYMDALWTMVLLLRKHAILVQCCIMSLCTSVTFTCYWTTLTFLLSSPQYPYSLPPYKIGLFGLIGITSIVLNPFYGKYVVGKLRVPLYAIVLGLCINLVGTIIGTVVGPISIAGPIIQGLLLDASFQIVGIAHRMAIYYVEPGASRNRINTAFMLVTFFGQIMGTSAGNKIYETYGGWRASGALSIGALVFALFIAGIRGPHEKRWVGWGGGWGVKDTKEVEEDAGRVDIESGVYIEEDNSRESEEVTVQS
ncbi:MFS general substrate transporter [Rhizodiscina lignyota]|uniref:MFS general substrate transporter n=1 Tax=Rhizodiscina lignyota TaxID=1504668 RepID=A0A9P4IPU1_9PEZI|nr:MFS general substrate transporter [Rhizodiscina lignyota]